MMRKLTSILLIDDDADDNYFHQIILEEMNVTENIQIASNGLEALAILKRNEIPPELIILDINMPKMNGWEFLEEYAKLPEGNKAKAIVAMLTTSQNAADKTRAKQYSCINTFYSKPLTSEMLSDILSNYFSGKYAG